MLNICSCVYLILIASDETYHFHPHIMDRDDVQNHSDDKNLLVWFSHLDGSTSEEDETCLVLLGFCLSIWCSVGNIAGCFHLIQSLSHVRLFVIPWTAAQQASLSITNSWSLLQLTSIESVMTSTHLILCHPLLLLPSILPNIRVFSNESVLCIRWPSIGVSASVSVFPMNIQDWFPLGWTSWISLQPKGLSGVLSNTTIQKHQFFGAQLS